MIYLAVLLLVLAALAPVWSRTRTGDFLAPGPLVVSIWAGTLGLYFLRLLPYPPLSRGAALAVSVGLGALLLGIWLGRRWERARVHRGATGRPTSLRGWIVGYGTAGLLGLGWYLYLVQEKLGWEVWISAPYRIRVALGTYAIPSSFLFLQFFCIVAPLLAVAALLSGQRLSWRHWLLVALCCAGTWVSTDRTQFFTIVLGCTFMYLYRYGRNLPWRGFAAALAVAGLLLGLNFFVVGYWVGKTGENLGFRLGEPAPVRAATAAESSRNVPLRVRMAPLYLYATASYAALSVWVQEDHPRTYGIQAAYPAARLLQRAKLLSSVPLPPAIPPFVPVAASDGGRVLQFNGYTFLYYPLQDFGIPGVAVYCLAIGLLTGWAYCRLRRARDSAVWLLVMSQIGLALVLSFFVNKFNNTASWYFLVLSIAPFAATRVVESARAWRGAPQDRGGRSGPRL